MLSGEGNENGEKTTIGLISKKATLHVQHTFFIHSFAVVWHDCNVKLPETSQLHVLRRKCWTCSCSLFFSLSVIFPLVAASIPPLQISCCYSNKKCLLLFFFLSLSLAPFLVELRWSVALLSLFLCFSLSLYSKFVDMTINLSLILQTTRIQKHFPLSVFVFIDYLIVSASQDAGGHTLSRQNNLAFGIGLHVVGVRTVVGRTLRQTKFSCFHRLPIYLSNGAPPRVLSARELR